MMRIANQPLLQLGPLQLFYETKGIVLPEVESLSGRELPEPERHLLVHDQDMTSQLKTFFQDEICVEVIHKELFPSTLNREVILRRQSDGLPVEYGAIRIRYSRLPSQAQAMVLECQKPLGAILHEFRIEFRSCPGCFFRLFSDSIMAAAFELTEPSILYGRCNLLMYADGKILADVVEILPPMERNGGISE